MMLKMPDNIINGRTDGRRAGLREGEQTGERAAGRPGGRTGGRSAQSKEEALQPEPVLPNTGNCIGKAGAALEAPRNMYVGG